MESKMHFKYDKISDFLIKLSSNIEIASCICFGLDLNVGPQVSEIIPYLEQHAIRAPITERLEEDLSKSISKHHTTLLHDDSSSLTSWLNYVRPSHDICFINCVGSDAERPRLVRDLLIYNIKQETKFIVLQNDSWHSAEVPMFDNTAYSLLNLNIGNRLYTLFYLDIVYKLLDNTSDKN